MYRIASWLYDTSLFEEAWSYVVFHPLNWWWSEQLCLFTVGAWTVFIATEGFVFQNRPGIVAHLFAGTRYGIKHLWAYMLLGQIVAISVASNLFYLALILSPKLITKHKSYRNKASPRLWLSVLISLASVAATPFTSRQTFLPNLLLMHALLFAPLLSTTTSTKRFSIGTATLYRIIQFAALAIRLRTVLNAMVFLNYAGHSGPTHPATAAWIILNSHPAQSSIGWDIIWTSISFILWQLTSSTSSEFLPTMYLILATPLASVGVTAPYSLLTSKKPSTSIKKDVKNE